MTPEVRTFIHRTSVVSAGLGVLMSPIPFLDEVALIPVLGVLCTGIARHHALKWNEVPWRPMVRGTAYGLVARAPR